MLAECAALQDRFEVTHNLLFSRQPSHEVISAPETVEALGVADSAEFLRCVEAQGTRSTVDADVEGGRALGIRGTPTLLIRDRLQLGGLTAEELEVALRKAY
jgi:protein-disulfide isomerase